MKYQKCKTIGELKKLLENIPDNFEWWGWDDGSMVIIDPDDDTKDLGIDSGKYDS